MALTTVRRAGLVGQAGNIIQIQRTQFTGTNTVSLSAVTDTVLSDLTVNITPTSTSSVIHLQAHIFYEHGEDDPNSWEHVFFFYRDSTKLGHTQAGDRLCGISSGTRTYHQEDDNSTPNVAIYDYFDSPSSTSQITYKVGIVVKTAETFALNRTITDTDDESFQRGISTIIATEIAG